MSENRLKYTLVFALLGALFFLPFLGAVHLFDWDEINFAEISREMIVTRDYLHVYINYLPFWEKPPFFFWLQSLSMHLFGVGEYAARFPNAICGVITLVLLYHIGHTLYSHRFGYLWALVYLGSILPHLYFRSGIIDPTFNLFIFSGIYLFVLFVWKKEQEEGINLKRSKWLYLFGGGGMIGLAILTKGPVAFLIAGLTFFIYWIFERFRMYVRVYEFLFFIGAMLLISLLYYGVDYWKNGSWFIQAFFEYQYRLFSTPDAGHKGFAGYHFIVLLIGCFPASVFAIRSFYRLPHQRYGFQQDFVRWMKILFWVVLILFSIVQSKIVHYSSLCYFPLSFLAALVIYQITRSAIPFDRWMKFGLGFIGSLFVLATLLAPFLGRHIDWLKPWFNDPFAQANLDADVVWTGLEVIPGIWLLIVLLGFFLKARSHFFQATRILFFGTAIFITLTLFFYINRIEGYSQNAAITFFKSKQGDDCYVIPFGYKSYAHLFYTQKPPVQNKKSHDASWLLTGDVDKDVFVVTKIHKAPQMEKFKEFKEIGRKNGFVFFKREYNPVLKE